MFEGSNVEIISKTLKLNAKVLDMSDKEDFILLQVLKGLKILCENTIPALEKETNKLKN